MLERVEAEEREPTGARGFAILDEPARRRRRRPVTADRATCAECLASCSTGDRRYRYPFINCTNCGPRFTIVRGVPYDRPFTTMAGLRDVRALPGRVRGPRATGASTPSPTPARTAGPRSRLLDGARHAARGRRRGDASQAAAGALRAGAIVAVKGIGGFHLACRADDERAVATLRSRKHREDKPFALMAGDARRRPARSSSSARRARAAGGRRRARSCSRPARRARRSPRRWRPGAPSSA